jgi:hypothetical protein
VSSSLNTGNVVTIDTTDLSLPSDLVVYWSIHFWVTLRRLTVCVTLYCNYNIHTVSYVDVQGTPSIFGEADIGAKKEPTISNMYNMDNIEIYLYSRRLFKLVYQCSVMPFRRVLKPKMLIERVCPHGCLNLLIVGGGGR